MNTNIFSDRKLADHVPIAIVLINKISEILWWNKSAEKLLHLNKNQYKKITDIFFLPNIDTFLKKKASIETALIKHPEVHISVSVTAYEKEQFLLFAQDITHLHHLERMRQDFVANVSHELRTPLTVIHGYLETLLQQVDHKKNDWKRIFEQMYQQSFRMEKLVEDLLLLSRLETDSPRKENFKQVDVAGMLLQISADAKELSGKKNHQIKLQVDKNLKIFGLEDELQSAFANLIFNAVNYTPEKGEITIKWFHDELQAYMQVNDTGIGIAAEDIPRITERFYRVDRARSRESGGTGLGLAIVKHALIHHKAQLKIESILGKGSTFTCVFSKKLLTVLKEDS